jgi:hypothetical protein
MHVLLRDDHHVTTGVPVKKIEVLRVLVGVCSLRLTSPSWSNCVRSKCCWGPEVFVFVRLGIVARGLTSLAMHQRCKCDNNWKPATEKTRMELIKSLARSVFIRFYLLLLFVLFAFCFCFCFCPVLFCALPFFTPGTAYLAQCLPVRSRRYRSPVALASYKAFVSIQVLRLR